ncbi:hypothetical protein H0X32_03810 [Patescibacteria group bacterium]|nr:hypothetical protein [Patescibacteria group bacterium]
MALSAEAKEFYKPRIGNAMAGLLIGTSILFWGVQFLISLTVVGEIGSEFIGIVGDGIFFLWLFLLRVNYFGKNSGKKVGLVIGATIIELIPFINDIPADVIEVIFLILITRKEDREIAEEKAAAAAQTAEIEQFQQIQYMQYMQQRAQIQQQQEEEIIAANDNAARAVQAANDDEEQELAEAA